MLRSSVPSQSKRSQFTAPPLVVDLRNAIACDENVRTIDDVIQIVNAEPINETVPWTVPSSSLPSNSVSKGSRNAKRLKKSNDCDDECRMITVVNHKERSSNGNDHRQSLSKTNANGTGNLRQLKDNGEIKRAFRVVWGKYKPYKKHKVWNGDGFLALKSSSVTLYDTEGISKGNTSKFDRKLEDGTCMVIGGNEVQIEAEINVKEFISGKLFDVPNESV